MSSVEIMQITLDTLFEQFGEAATWRPSTGPAKALTVKRAAPVMDEFSIQGQAFREAEDVFDIRSSELTVAPEEGDRLELADATLLEVRGAPLKMGRGGLKWRVGFTPIAI